MSKVFLPKDDQRIPDFYGVKIEYITGQTKEFKVASHSFINSMRAIEIVTFDNEYVVVPMDNVVLYFDKDFTKIVEIKKELENQKSQQNMKGNNLNGSTETEL
jgi:hypothetical protein